MKNFGLILMLGTFVGFVIASDDRFNQQPEVKSLREEVRLLAIVTHTHAYDDYAIRIAHLESRVDLAPADRRMLSYYISQKERVSVLLTGLEE